MTTPTYQDMLAVEVGELASKVSKAVRTTINGDYVSTFNALEEAENKLRLCFTLLREIPTPDDAPESSE